METAVIILSSILYIIGTIFCLYRINNNTLNDSEWYEYLLIFVWWPAILFVVIMKGIFKAVFINDWN